MRFSTAYVPRGILNEGTKRQSATKPEKAPHEEGQQRKRGEVELRIFRIFLKYMTLHRYAILRGTKHVPIFHDSHQQHGTCRGRT
jgi:hypothetical protein